MASAFLQLGLSRNCDFKKSLVDEVPFAYALRFDGGWLGNFERGEIVSPVGSIASKVVGNYLVTPDARHRRPLKFLLYHQSVKTQRTAPRALSPSWIRAGLPFRLGCFHLSFRSTEMAE
jgi:hypothetical protein